MHTSTAATVATRLGLEDPDAEVAHLIGQLSALENFTTLADPADAVQFTADELYHLFHGLKRQAENIAIALALPTLPVATA